MRPTAVAGVLVAVPFIAYGIWLVATPDYDGGRRPVGTLVLVLRYPYFWRPFGPPNALDAAIHARSAKDLTKRTGVR
jgi:hypothetical protein